MREKRKILMNELSGTESVTVGGISIFPYRLFIAYHKSHKEY